MTGSAKSEGSKVARRTDAALRGHDRVHAPLEHVAEPLDELGPAARVAESKGVGAQEKHGPHDLDRQWLPDSRGVAEKQPFLELAGLVRRHEGRGQRPEAGGHAVDASSATSR
jgi:hypothetical protein